MPSLTTIAGWFTASDGEYDRAIEDCNKAIELDPSYAEPYSNRGAAYREKGEEDRAIEDYDKAIQLKPDFIEAHYNRAVAYTKKGNFDRAIVGYTKTIELKCDLAAAYNNRGNAYTKKGKIDHAIDDYNRAIELKPDLAEPYAGRGVAQLHLKEWKKARADLTDAKNMGMDIITVFHFFYESVPDFEDKNGAKLPEEIAAMLTAP